MRERRDDGTIIVVMWLYRCGAFKQNVMGVMLAALKLGIIICSNVKEKRYLRCLVICDKRVFTIRLFLLNIPNIIFVVLLVM